MNLRFIVTISLIGALSGCDPAPSTSKIADVDCPTNMGKPIKRHCEMLLARDITPDFSRLNSVLATNTVREANPPVAGLQWKAIGPSPIVNFPNNPSIPVAGRMGAIAIDPRNSAHWFAGSAAGGIFESRNAGASWQPVQDQGEQPLLGVSAIAIHPKFPDTIYAGTGEPYPSSDSYGGLGILRSDDGGKTWSLPPDSPFAGWAVSDLVLDSNDPNVVIAATAYASLPATKNVRGQLGIFRSTDRGENWEITLSEAKISDLEVNASDQQKIYAGGIEFHTENAKLWRSDDGGESWEIISGPWESYSDWAAKVMLASSKTNPNVLYVSVGASKLEGLWKTKNAWSNNPSFELIDTSATGDLGYCGSQCWYSHAIAVSALNENTLYAGGISLWKYNGISWTDIGKSRDQGRLHADQHAIRAGITRGSAFFNEVDHLIVANDGGIAEWRDVTNPSWESRVNGLTVTQFWSGTVSRDGKTVVGGAQDNGTSRRDTIALDSTWNSIIGGDGFDAFAGGANDARQNALIATVQHTGIYRSLDGVNFTNASEGIRAEQAQRPFITRVAQCSFISDFEITNSRGGILKTVDFFSASSPSWFLEGNNEDNTQTTAIGFSRLHETCGIYAYGTDSGQVHVTVDHGVSWRTVWLDPVNNNARVTGIAFSPTPADYVNDRFFVSYSGFDHPHLYRISCATRDLSFSDGIECGGADLEEDLGFPVDMPINGLDVDPVTDTLFLATDNSVWMLKNATTCVGTSCTWTNFGVEHGMPNVIVYEVKVAPEGRLVVAFTHGRGAYSMDISSLE